MSTHIKTITGTCHKHVNASNKVTHEEAEISLTRFFNGAKKGRNIQITVTQSGAYGTSYIHLNKTQCEKLGFTLLNCFDNKKYPSE